MYIIVHSPSHIVCFYTWPTPTNVCAYFHSSLPLLCIWIQHVHTKLCPSPFSSCPVYHTIHFTILNAIHMLLEVLWAGHLEISEEGIVIHVTICTVCCMCMNEWIFHTGPHECFPGHRPRQSSWLCKCCFRSPLQLQEHRAWRQMF